MTTCNFIYEFQWFKKESFRCHEKPFSENPAQAKHNEVTQFYAYEVEKAVDFFHFPGTWDLSTN